MDSSSARPLADLRKDYSQRVLDEGSCPDDPLALFARWFDEALDAKVHEPNAMTLATIDPDGSPSARVVLLKGLDARGMSFFTNRTSRKGRAIASEPRVSLVFFWPELERQVRVRGRAERLPDTESDAYFASRPRASQLGAWASAQSETLPDRPAMETLFARTETRFEGRSVERPPHWGGYLVVPAAIEFWQGRRSRMHDRVEYTREPHGWSRRRLAP
jgi:pyridoxamine 5'-phosphate oxidase